MTEEIKNIFMEAQKGELDAVIMYNMLADTMKSENKEIAENHCIVINSARVKAVFLFDKIKKINIIKPWNTKN